MEKYTDQEFFYKQTPVNYDGIAKFTSIKGNTLGWNQLVQNGDFESTSNWNTTSCSFTVSNKKATVKASNSTDQFGIYPSAMTLVQNHKYLITFKVTLYGSVRVSRNKIDSTGNTGRLNSGTYATIENAVNTSFGMYRFLYAEPVSDTANDYYTLENAMLFDLTQMGLDITSTSDFTSLFSLPYYDYNAGTLLSFNGTGMKTANADETEEHTTNLPVSTYFPTGMKSAGSVYDELTPTKAITRIGAVDLGSLTWGYQSEYTRFRASLTGFKPAATQYVSGNILCDKYTAGSMQETQTVNNVIAIGVSDINYVYIKDTSYTDANAFKESLQGVYLYYELATETETDAEDIFYKFYADGTEQLLPVNGSSPSTSYLIADIEYYDSTDGDSLYRRFWLINGDGERWDLTDKEFKSFLNNPTGLGFRKTIEITRYGEKANKNNEVYDFPQPSGELLFYDTYNSTRYDKYNKFIRFLMSQPITLYYMIPVSYISGIANIFTLNCDVTEVQKTESKTDHILTSSIVFNGLGFYEGDEISVNGTTDTYTLTNEGDFPVGFEITVEGSLTKPYITLSQDGELYGEAKFDSATAFNSLYIDSNDGEQNIILQQGGSVIPNPLSYQDLSISNGSIYVTFVKLAKGVSELSIGVESGSITNVNIKYSPKYRSV